MARPWGLYKRGRSWYARLWQDGNDKRVSLGTDYNVALDRLHKLQHEKDGQSLG